jgi:dTDP-4-dehydrorhamnose reductase
VTLRILLTGAHGQLGSELLPLLRPLGEVTALGRAECDLSSPESIRRLVEDARPQLIVNPAAYTAVNDAESHRELAFAINATAPAVLAQECRKHSAMLIHYSTDYVFNGEKAGPYTEDDEPGPLNVYGASKLAGERAVAESGGRWVILRTSWVYGPGGSNFLRTIRRLATERDELRIVDDQVGAPTSSLQLARATVRLAEQCAHLQRPQFPSGLYHCTAAGSVSWCGFARAIVEALRAASPEAGPEAGGKLCNITPVSTSEYPTPARRPLNSVLSNEKFRRTFGFRLESWKEGLVEVMAELRRREAVGECRQKTP